MTDLPKLSKALDEDHWKQLQAGTLRHVIVKDGVKVTTKTGEHATGRTLAQAIHRLQQLA